jgi:hypothetical protein
MQWIKEITRLDSPTLISVHEVIDRLRQGDIIIIGFDADIGGHQHFEHRNALGIVFKTELVQALQVVGPTKVLGMVHNVRDMSWRR